MVVSRRVERASPASRVLVRIPILTR